MAQINVKVDQDLKDQSSKILEDLGMDMTTGIRIFLNQLVKTEGIPFEVTLRKSLYQQAMDDVKNGNVETFNNVDDLFKDLGM